MIVVPEVHGHVAAVYSGTSFITRIAQVVVNVTVVQSGPVKVMCQMSAGKSVGSCISKFYLHFMI